MTIGAPSEPALLVAILALSVPAHSSNLPPSSPARSPILCGWPARNACWPWWPS